MVESGSEMARFVEVDSVAVRGITEPRGEDVPAPAPLPLLPSTGVLMRRVEASARSECGSGERGADSACEWECECECG